jgi:hypothetical protein
MPRLSVIHDTQNIKKDTIAGLHALMGLEPMGPPMASVSASHWGSFSFLPAAVLTAIHPWTVGRSQYVQDVQICMR